MNLKKLFSAAVAVAVFAVLAMTATGIDAWQQPGADGVEDMEALVVALFTDHVIALEVLGVLLTAAMIGALVIARPLGVPLDETHYGVPDVTDKTPHPAEGTAPAHPVAPVVDVEEEE